MDVMGVGVLGVDVMGVGGLGVDVMGMGGLGVDVMGVGGLRVDVIDLKIDFFLLVIIKPPISIKNGRNIFLLT